MPIASRVLVLLILLGVLLPVEAQLEPRRKFVQFSVADGLPENSVLAMAQDHFGFLWLGTGNGLVRYDGYQFKEFVPRAGDKVGRDIRALLVDTEGDLWIGSMDGGLFHFDQKSYRFTGHFHDADDPRSISSNMITCLGQDRDGVLWVGTSEGLNRFDGKGFKRFLPIEGDAAAVSHPWIRTVFEDSLGRFWVGTNGGLDLMDRATETFRHYRHDPDDPKSLSHPNVSSVYEDRKGRLWVGTGTMMGRPEGGGLNRYLPEVDGFAHYRHNPNDFFSLSHDNVLCIQEDPGGQLWVGTVGTDMEGGLNLFDPETNRSRRFSHNPADSSSMSHNRVTTMLLDRTNILWLGSLMGGLNKTDLLPERFHNVRHNPAHLGSPSTNNIRGIAEDADGNLWLSCWGGGLDHFNKTDGYYTHYKYDPAAENSLSSHLMTFVMVDRDGYVWAGTWFRGINRLDPKTGKITHFKHDQERPDSFGNDLTFAAMQDRKGRLWFGHGDGLDLYLPETGGFKHYKPDPTRPEGVGRGLVCVLYEDSRGVLWVGLDDGPLFTFDPETERFQSYAHVNPRLSTIVDIKEDGKGRMWIGSYSGGVFMYDHRTGVFEPFNESHGLPHDTVRGLLVDDRDNLWISTLRGLARYNRDSGEVKAYDTSDGLPAGMDFWSAAAFKDSEGYFYFGGKLGFIYFKPDEIVEDPFKPPVVVTDFRIFDQPVSIGREGPVPAHVSSLKTIRLPYWQNDVSFDFAALNFRNPSNNQYAFQLENYDLDWRTPAGRRTATYTNLAPKSYIFRVKGSNGDGLFNEAGAAIQLIIEPPWWRTLWAYLAYIVLGAALIFGIVALRVRSLRARTAELETEVERRTAEVVKQKELVEAAKATIEEQANKLLALDQLKSQFFANISHEFRTPLSLVLGPIQDIRGGLYGKPEPKLLDQLDVMERNASRLLRLINQLLDLSRLEAGGMALVLAQGDMLPLIKGNVQSFLSLAERRGMTLELRTPDETIEGAFDRDKLEKILTNLLSNAFKFTGKGGRIRVDARRLDDQGRVWLEMRVKDSGRGIPAEAMTHIFDRFHQVDASSTREIEGSGIGLALTRELVLLIGGTIEVTSEVGFGSEFVVRLPIDMAADTVFSEPPTPNPEAAVAATEYALDAEDTESGMAEEPAEDAPTVLIVEDNADVRAYIKQHLATRYHILEACDGEAGLAMAREKKPDLVVCDVMMPKLDGYGLCRQLKADAKLNHIPLILLTAKASDESKVEGLETGADDYIYKPFNAGELLVRAENLIEVRRLLRRKFSDEVVIAPTQIAVESADAVFLEKVRDLVEANMGDHDFSVEALAKEVGLSPRQLHRRLRALVNLSSNGFIRTMRLKRAAWLLENQTGGVAEIAYQVGFKDVNYFSRLFRQTFDATPSEYLGSQQNHQPRN